MHFDQMLSRLRSLNMGTQYHRCPQVILSGVFVWGIYVFALWHTDWGPSHYTIAKVQVQYFYMP